MFMLLTNLPFPWAWYSDANVLNRVPWSPFSSFHNTFAHSMRILLAQSVQCTRTDDHCRTIRIANKTMWKVDHQKCWKKQWQITRAQHTTVNEQWLSISATLQLLCTRRNANISTVKWWCFSHTNSQTRQKKKCNVLCVSTTLTVASFRFVFDSRVHSQKAKVAFVSASAVRWIRIRLVNVWINCTICCHSGHSDHFIHK